MIDSSLGPPTEVRKTVLVVIKIVIIDFILKEYERIVIYHIFLSKEIK